MQIESQSGRLVIDYYRIQDWYCNIIQDKVLKIMTLNGETFSKSVITTQNYVNDVYNRITHFNFVDNFVEHTTPQFVSTRELNRCE